MPIVTDGLSATSIGKQATISLAYECGGGAWGSGAAFLAILKQGDKVVSNDLEVWENVGGELKNSHHKTLAEYELKYGSPNIEIL